MKEEHEAIREGRRALGLGLSLAEDASTPRNRGLAPEHAQRDSAGVVVEVLPQIRDQLREDAGCEDLSEDVQRDLQPVLA